MPIEIHDQRRDQVLRPLQGRCDPRRRAAGDRDEMAERDAGVWSCDSDEAVAVCDGEARAVVQRGAPAARRAVSSARK